MSFVSESECYTVRDVLTASSPTKHITWHYICWWNLSTSCRLCCRLILKQSGRITDQSWTSRCVHMIDRCSCAVKARLHCRQKHIWQFVTFVAKIKCFQRTRSDFVECIVSILSLSCTSP